MAASQPIPFLVRSFRPSTAQSKALAVFLAQIVGGPCEHARRSWWLSLSESHRRFPIGQPERDAWMENMRHALDDVRVEEPSRSALLLAFFDESSKYLMNRPVARERPVSRIHRDIAPQWEVQLALDEVVAAVRKGDPDRVVKLIECPRLQTYLKRDRAAFVSLLAVMCGVGRPARWRGLHLRPHTPARGGGSR